MLNNYLKHLKALVQENRVNHKILRLSNQELDWANVYHDSIRGIHFLETLPLSIGRWAGGYAFFYVLHRILNDYRPKKILEFGLGESTKMINAYLEHELTDSIHDVLEQEPDWKSAFEKRVNLSSRTQIHLLPLEKKEVESFDSLVYQDIEKHVTGKYNLYVVDGPLGSSRFSRFDIVTVTKNLTREDDFIILLDDYNRLGEQDTFKFLAQSFHERGIPIVTGVYQGNKTVAIMASLHYKYINTL